MVGCFKYVTLSFPIVLQFNSKYHFSHVGFIPKKSNSDFPFVCPTVLSSLSSYETGEEFGLSDPAKRGKSRKKAGIQRNVGIFSSSIWKWIEAYLYCARLRLVALFPSLSSLSNLGILEVTPKSLIFLFNIKALFLIV